MRRQLVTVTAEKKFKNDGFSRPKNPRFQVDGGGITQKPQLRFFIFN